jgi:hypothetical protein
MTIVQVEVLSGLSKENHFHTTIGIAPRKVQFTSAVRYRSRNRGVLSNRTLLTLERLGRMPGVV